MTPEYSCAMARLSMVKGVAATKQQHPIRRAPPGEVVERHVRLVRPENELFAVSRNGYTASNQP